MHPDTFDLLTELVDTIERRLRTLRPYLPHVDQRARFDELTTTGTTQARVTLRLCDELPFRERAAIGAMFASCDALLALHNIVSLTAWPPKLAREAAFAERDLIWLARELFEYLVAPAVPAKASVHN